MGEFFKTEMEDDGIMVVTMNRDDREMNVLSSDLMDECNQLVESFSDPSVKGVVFMSGKPDHFIAGADIDEIAGFKTSEDGRKGSQLLSEMFSEIAKSKVPTVAAVHGSCLGGGLELSLSCDWRVVTSSPKTKLGLPEIQLGLIPGAGGTQRLPRLIGIQSALDMILTGKRVDGKRAQRMGLADACVPEHLLRQEALKMARKKRRKAAGGLTTTSITKELPKAALEGNPVGRKIMAQKAREMVDKNAKGFYPAPYKALEAVFKGYGGDVNKGLDLESKLFGELAVTRESASLVHLYHAITALKKHPYKEAGKERFGDQKTELVGIIGSGFMGSGIATVCANKDLRVRISDPNKESLGKSLKHVNDYFKKRVKRRRLKPFQAEQKLARVSPGLTPDGFGHCDLVIEAVFENLDLKRKLLKQVEAEASEDWIFASNTSAMPIAKIAEESSHKDRVLGMHFFSPVEKMPLLEVVVTDDTAEWATARVVQLGQDIGKQVIVVKDGPGFYTTRTLSFYLAEAMQLLQDGNPIDVIDEALTKAGFPVGPMTLIDEVGIDVGAHVMETMVEAFGDRMIKPPEAFSQIEGSDRLGRKTGKGLYLYEDGKKGEVDESIYDEFGLERRSGSEIDRQHIVDRCVLVFVNESVRCLEEGILRCASDGDVGAVFGLGFPPFWGGPFKYIDHVGPKAVVDQLKALSDSYGARFAPAALLLDHASSGKKFFPEEG